uniref:Gag-pol polyprotein n=1 Tax=Solanum tuberosum TaxID=4113 RepID=M1D7Z9_SOLTU
MGISCESVQRTGREMVMGGNRAQSSSVAPPNRAAPRGATSGAGGGTNLLYAINSRQEQEDLSDIVTDKTQVYKRFYRSWKRVWIIDGNSRFLLIREWYFQFKDPRVDSTVRRS